MELDTIRLRFGWAGPSPPFSQLVSREQVKTPDFLYKKLLICF
jgi:hypothetical protein